MFSVEKRNSPMLPVRRDTMYAMPAMLKKALRSLWKSATKNPVEIARRIMEDPYIYMHGPEHHVMVGAVLLTAYRNSGGDIDLKEALEEMKERGSQIPGGVCGFWGCCGAGVSTGIYMSIVTGATPLAGRSWGLANRTTAKALEAIGELGGPRCCKRDTFTAIRKAAEMTAKELGVEMDCPAEIVCTFSHFFGGKSAVPEKGLSVSQVKEILLHIVLDKYIQIR